MPASTIVPPGRARRTASTTGRVAWGVVSTTASTPSPPLGEGALDRVLALDVDRRVGPQLARRFQLVSVAAVQAGDEDAARTEHRQRVAEAEPSGGLRPGEVRAQRVVERGDARGYLGRDPVQHRPGRYMNMSQKSDPLGIHKTKITLMGRFLRCTHIWCSVLR